MLRQKQMEQLLIENRVRKLKIEEERLQKQIKIANKHSDMADAAAQRRADDQALKDQMKMMEEQRIANQRAKNEDARMRTIQKIHQHQNAVFENAAESREHLNGFLKSNYDNFFKEKLAEHAKKAQNA